MTEKEALSRYVDGLQKASSRAEEFLRAKNEDKPQLFVDFIDGIKVAAGSAHQLAHSQQNPKWLDTRDLLEGIIAVGMSLPVFSENDGQLWNGIKKSLDMMVITGKKLGSMKAMTRIDVLTHLDVREKNAESLSK